MATTKKHHLDICFSPALYSHYHRDGNLVVVIDLFRATTAITTALANGAKSLRPVAEIDEALSCKAKGYLIAGERNGYQLENFDFGNSPLEFSPDKVRGKRVAMTTTNGTRAFAAANGQQVIAASLLNYSAVIDYINTYQGDVLLLCSGWTMKMNIEDTLLAGKLANDLLAQGEWESHSDSIAIANAMLEKAGEDWLTYILKSSPRLNGKYEMLKDDIEWALQQDKTDVVPMLLNNELYTAKSL